mgnify:CR=1 FL=1
MLTVNIIASYQSYKKKSEIILCVSNICPRDICCHCKLEVNKKLRNFLLFGVAEIKII